MASRDVITDFVNKRIPRGHKEPYGKQGNIFYRGDILFDFGEHFPMLIRHPWGYLLNADKYSVTTSKHQGYCRHIATVQIPLSALRTAGIPYTNFNLVEAGKERIDTLRYCRRVPNPDAKTMTIEQYKALDWRQRKGWNPDDWQNPTKYYWSATKEKKEYISIAQWEALSEEDREKWYAVTERRPQHDVIEYQGRYYLSGMDGDNYFLCQLPEPVKTVEEAIEHLVPNELRPRWLRESLIRQGEWFFRPVTEPDFAKVPKNLQKRTRERVKGLQKDFILPLTNADSNTHTATRGGVINGFIYVTGSIRHSEHKTVKLCTLDAPVIYQAYRNRAVESFSVNGRVD